MLPLTQKIQYLYVAIYPKYLKVDQIFSNIKWQKFPNIKS